ncbi:mannosyltransferase [Ascosphaera acerosa]|nr:mannosyltransferase [Ascosphaera acerosa]
MNDTAQQTLMWRRIEDDVIAPATLLTMSRHQFLRSYGLLCIPAVCIACAFFLRHYLVVRARRRAKLRGLLRRHVFAQQGLPAPTGDHDEVGLGQPQRDDDGEEVIPERAMVVVLGDIGHSPRMQNHALSLAKRGTMVYFVGYLDSEPQADLLYDPMIQLVPIDPPPAWFAGTESKLLFPFMAVLKVLHQIGSLWAAVRYECPRCDFAIVQMIIDWHNFGYSILAMKLGPRHPLVLIMKFFEHRFCRLAHAHFCVSKAMAETLRKDLHITQPIRVLYDRPAEIFQPMTSVDERFAFLSRQPETTQFVQKMLDRRCALLMSSTSWTPDEDFGILIEALVQYSALAAAERDDLPFLGVIITGKGPQRQQYLNKVAALSAEGRLDRVTVKSTWLSFEDYARTLACADLGISLHTSSSGVDLPMKVLDMFGAGLPVVGWDDYAAWPELVTEGVDGLGFKSATALADILVRLFSGGGNRATNDHELATLREGARVQSLRRWDEEWEKRAVPILEFVSPNCTDRQRRRKKKRGGGGGGVEQQEKEN